jgi:peptide-methionine (S)-S-oxide reductase
MEPSGKTWKILALLAAAVCAVLLIYGYAEKKKEYNMNGSGADDKSHAVERVLSESTQYETATFAAGCFWGVQAAFSKIDGVISTAAGYTGGHLENPTYQQVCSDKTGHAEAVQITYDPKVVSYEKLLDLFWKIHDPTTPNRQGPDVGSQYRSAIFYHSPEQLRAAQKSKQHLQANLARPIVTEIVPASAFYKAEEYHQQYLKKQGKNSCEVPEK